MNRAAQIIHLNYARREHLTGKGIGIAIFDTGIGFHPDLFSSGQTKLAAFIDTVYGKKNIMMTMDTERTLPESLQGAAKPATECSKESPPAAIMLSSKY